MKLSLDGQYETITGVPVTLKETVQIGKITYFAGWVLSPGYDMTEDITRVTVVLWSENGYPSTGEQKFHLRLRPLDLDLTVAHLPGTSDAKIITEKDVKFFKDQGFRIIKLNTKDGVEL
jgi:hypothetical protein